MVQHIVVIGPNEVAHQSHCRHATTTYDYVGLCPSIGHTLQHDVIEVHNKQRPLGYVTKVQGLGKDQARPR